MYYQTGFPFVVGVIIAFAIKRMARENLFVRSLKSCETMAKASVICADKTGTLTQNQMAVVATSVGVHANFVRKLSRNAEEIGGEARNKPNLTDFDSATDLSSISSALTPQLAGLFNAAIVVNSTAYGRVDPESDAVVFTGSKTEMALLKFTKALGLANPKDTRDSHNILQTFPFSSDHKSTGCVVQLPDGGYRLYIKGASEILTQKCTRYVVVDHDTASASACGNGVETAQIGKTEEDSIACTIKSYASRTLRTIALCYRDLGHWPPKGVRMTDNGQASRVF